MQNFYLDTLGDPLQLHDNTNASDFWLQTPVEGLDMPNLRVSQYDKPGEDSSVVSNILYSAHTVNLVGTMRGDSAYQYELNRRRLAQALSITRDSNGFIMPKRCTFTTLFGDQFFFDSFMAAKPIFNHDQINWTHFQIQLVIPKALIFGANEVTTGAITRPTGGGFILPVILPITSSGSTGGNATVTNYGNTTTPPILKLTGPLTNSFIRNTANNKSMQLNYTIPTGSYVTIDMYEKTILLNDTSSILSAKTDDSNWWGIEPGNNTIVFSTGSTSDTGNLQVSFFNGYLGV